MSIYVRIRDGMSNATEGDVRGFASDIISQGGVLSTADDHFLVEEKGTPDMSVDVNPGIAYVLNSSWSAFSSSIKCWDVLLDAVANVAIGSNASGLTRIDKICVKVDTAASPDADASNVASVIVVAGTPGAGTPATPSNHLALATVTVVDGETTITNSEITDVRTQMSLTSNSLPSDIVTLTGSQTLTNKTISAASNTLTGVATLTGIQTLTNKRITKRIGTITSSATPTPAGDDVDVFTVTALAEAATFAAPTGTPTNGQTLVIRVLDNGTARTLAFNAIYRFSTDLAAPTTTILSKTLYLGFIYNSAATKWDCVAIINNF